MLTNLQQHSASERSEIAKSQRRYRSCSFSRYNIQRSREHLLPALRAVVSYVHCHATTLSEPEVSNCLVPEPWLIMFTYHLQHSASQRSAIALCQNCG